MVFGYYLPSSTKKTNRKKIGPPLGKLSGSADARDDRSVIDSSLLDCNVLIREIKTERDRFLNNIKNITHSATVIFFLFLIVQRVCSNGLSVIK